MKDERFRTPSKTTPVRYWRHEDVPGVEFAQTSSDKHAFAPRVESAYGFFYLKRGPVSFFLRGRLYTVPAGTLLLVSPGEAHAARGRQAWQAQAAFVDADVVTGITYDLTGKKVRPAFQGPFLPTHFAADFVAF